ncbi:hypothetical protein CTheo_7896 [Ceratobasidium theobromae]|uniref:Peptidase A1 domain-containing protein n=1 Tax=Ceratobasidium theobromae TaxID=1582974 RepID=A0A5N5QB56_9AGAM|nr:hypothetical protein CTheo_7896 [Ceratobasidium theobromae]
MSTASFAKPRPPTPRPSLKRSLTSLMNSFTRKSRGKISRRASVGSQVTVPRRPTQVRFPSQSYSRPQTPRVEIVESGGVALVEAQDAFTNSRRPVWTRILWSVPSEHDSGVRKIISKLGQKEVAEGLASLGVRKYLETGRGAIFCNAHSNLGSTSKLVVDWITFRDTQKTRDKMLQRDVLSNDPSSSVLIYVFITLQDKRSVAIWRKRVPLSVNILARNSVAISSKKRELQSIEAGSHLNTERYSPANEDVSPVGELRTCTTASADHNYPLAKMGNLGKARRLAEPTLILSPIPSHEGFSVHAARNTRYRPNGPQDYAKCIRKYRIGGTTCTPFFFDLHKGCVCRHQQREAIDTYGNISGNVRVPAVNLDPDDGMTVVQAKDIQNDTEYACPVTIGNPGVTLILDFDTGSSDFWVWSSEFRASRKDLENHNIYDPRRSSSSEKLPGETWEIHYGDGSHASGDVHLDTVTIGDITIKRQAVEVSQRLSDQFLQGGSDGLLGLAFPKLNTVRPHQQKTPMQNMVEQGLVKDPIFTVKLDKHDSRGFYTFGYIDSSVHSSKLYWQPVIPDNGWWEVPSAYVRIGKHIYDRGWQNTAIIVSPFTPYISTLIDDRESRQDTGTTLILLDDETIELLYSQIPGARLDRNIGGYIFPTKARVPSLAFCVGYWLFTIPSSDLAFSDAGNGMSFGAIQSRGQNAQDILGDDPGRTGFRPYPSFMDWRWLLPPAITFILRRNRNPQVKRASSSPILPTIAAHEFIWRLHWRGRTFAFDPEAFPSMLPTVPSIGQKDLETYVLLFNLDSYAILLITDALQCATQDWRDNM